MAQKIYIFTKYSQTFQYMYIKGPLFKNVFWYYGTKGDMVDVHQRVTTQYSDCRMRMPGDQMHSVAAAADNTVLHTERF